MEGGNGGRGKGERESGGGGKVRGVYRRGWWREIGRSVKRWGAGEIKSDGRRWQGDIGKGVEGWVEARG